MIVKRYVLGAAVGACLCTAAGANGPPAIKAQPPPVAGIVPDHDAFSVADISRDAAWYERVLGFKVVAKHGSSPDFRNWRLQIHGYSINLVQAKGSKRPPPVDPIYLRQGWIHLVFRVRDVAAALKELQALHVKVNVTYLCGHNIHATKPCSNGVPLQLHFDDPEGNRLEIGRDTQFQGKAG
jgi:catechol 2,3-dioxygenase-like lactoylglutathione lyase family enzyme